jgi:hypothetical protein
MSTRTGRSLAIRNCGVPAVVLTGILFAVPACEKRASVSNGVLDSLVAAYPCNESLPEVTRAPDSLTQPQTCALLAKAMGRLAEAGPSDLPEPVDTSAVAAATIDPMSEQDFSEKLKGAWWVVTLQLRDTPFNVEVRIDRQTGGTKIRQVHK